MNEILLSGGKKVRPALCFLMGGVLGVSSEKMSPYARAAELTHMASLAHDDVIDEAAKRRNTSTLNAACSNSEAVLAGDLLLARVMTEVSALGRVEIIHDLSCAVEDLVSGELLQLERRQQVQPTEENLLEVARKKTGSLMAWCCKIAARLADSEEAILRSCGRFGESLGIAFQMVDDILDFEVRGEKPYAQDLREGLVNFVSLEMIRSNPSLIPKIQVLFEKPESFSKFWSESELENAKSKVRTQARSKLLEARELLSAIVESSKASRTNANPYYQALETVIGFLGERFI